ncbi:hypothetical protein FSP39_006748 [Pinctada imbricata]|uniref:Uncharacterized protein n=1 Tax=Pinctada imbricata TaxID=66713 RepID=A0AA88Y3G0_PINIB|nr:hypothetical protein FSP39_006748 [Pinctada imbricata]
MHIMFVRRHNRIVEALRAAALSPLNAEILYQEAKRIVIAELQHITYNEFLPRVLGVDVMNRYDLWPASLYRDTYDPYVDPRTTSGFSVAAYRFGHSLVRNIHNQVTPFGGVSRLNLQDHFDRLETHLYPFPGGNTEGFARWMKISQKSAADRAFVDGLQNNLFPCDGPDCPMGGGVTRTLDLAALNIQRGRDHGLPSYREWRYRCTGRWAYTFEPNAMGLSDHSQFEAINLGNTYSHVGDIDLFTGGMTETRLPGALVGPTFACIIGQQFQNYKRGDRFFYEREDPVMAFTPGMLFLIFHQNICLILSIFVPRFRESAGTLKPSRLSVRPSVRQSEKL